MNNSQNQSSTQSSQTNTQSTTEPVQTTASQKSPQTETCDRIILILDESVSMRPQAPQVITGVNDMIREQQRVEPDRNDQVQFTVVKFNDTITKVRDQPLSSVQLMTTQDYTPACSTRLYDAIGTTLTDYANERNVVVCIVTDGEENSSRDFCNYRTITQMTTDYKEQKGWKFIYLSEDIDTFAQGNQLGFTSNATNDGTQNRVVPTGSLGLYMSSGAHNTDVSDFRLASTRATDIDNT